MPIGNPPRDTLNPSYSRLTGHVKYELARLIATGGSSNGVLAHRYGVTPGAITQFKRREKPIIDAIRAKLDDDFAGMWIAQKKHRIAEYQEMADVLGNAIEDLVEAGQCDPDMVRARMALLKQVSEEMGQLPPRQTVLTAQVTHTVEGYTSDQITSMLT